MKNAQQMSEQVAEQATQVGEQATQQGLRLAEDATEQVEDAAEQADSNSLPIENHDKLNVSEVSGKLDGLYRTRGVAFRSNSL